jgi:hypothetical protein
LKKLENDKLRRDFIQKLFDDESKPLGLVLSERMMNIPVQVAPHLHKNLYEEITWAVEDCDLVHSTDMLQLTISREKNDLHSTFQII